MMLKNEIITETNFRPEEFDSTLIDLINNASNGIAETKIIIQVNGFFAEGTVISANNYFKIVAENHDEGQFQSYILGVAESLDKDPNPYPLFIHLVDVSFHSSTTGGAITFPLWRAKLKDITGFTYGSFNKVD